MDRNRPPLGQWLRRGVFLAPLLFLALFFIYPLLTIFGVSLVPEGQLDLSGFLRLVTTDYYLNTLLFTLGQAILSTALTLALALPSAYVFTRYSFRGKSLFLSLATLPFVLPTVVVAAAFSSLIGPRGLLNTFLMPTFGLAAPPIALDRTLTIILIVHVFYNYAVALRIIVGFWANQNPRIEQAARVLGASGWRLWWQIWLPILRPAITAAGILVFIFTFTSFGVVLLLGGPRFATLEVEIYRQTVNLFNLPVAAALSLVQIVLMFAFMLVYTRLQRRLTTDVTRVANVAKAPTTRREKAVVAVNLLLIAILLFAPLISLVAASVRSDQGITLQFYRQLSSNPRGSILFVPPVQAIGNSLLFAVVTTVLALALGLITAYLVSGRVTRWSRLLDPLFMLPLATSAVTLGFGYIISLDKPPLNLRSSALLIPIAHTLVAMPFVVRNLLPALRTIPPSYQEAARVLGASGWQVWRLIDLPLISRAMLVGATFAFTTSMGEFGASLFVARPDTPTIPIVIFRLLSQPGALNYGQALAMSSLLLIVSALGFVLIERLGAAGVGEF
ncbi:MAG: iron ABC transporter permease [Chloroflexi bacterium]|nr:iron ABC transporter permease [Chloroflexota bacterium]MCC6893521.1 iron ABC transporter permease [Anaerolineae bacterium]